MSLAIEATNLTKIYPQESSWLSLNKSGPMSVKDVSLRVPTSSVFGLIGANGAGKTTLLKMLCTLITPTSGSAIVAGQPLDVYHGGKIRQKIGLVVADERSFYWRLTGRQNLIFFAALHGKFGVESHAKVDELLKKVDLTEAADQRFDRYSSGMKQRLAIARGLLNQPEILFLDEPGRSLDSESKHKIYDLIMDLNQKRGMTIFLITHDLAEADRLCDQTGRMEKGEMTLLS